MSSVKSNRIEIELGIHARRKLFHVLSNGRRIRVIRRLHHEGERVYSQYILRYHLGIYLVIFHAKNTYLMKHSARL